jgi:hypothetical protein
MKKTLMVLVLSSLALIACQKKKDDAPAGPVGCQQSHTFSPGLGQCTYNGHCQLGFVQHPVQPTMCADVRTGAVVETQRCATGYILSTSGCVLPCPTNRNLAFVNGACVEPASPVSGYFNINQQNGAAGFQQPAWQTYPNSNPGNFGQGAGWYRPW